MFVRNSRVYYSASDLKAAVECEWALMRKLDAKLGRIEAIEEADDPMLARASLLGGEHEARALENYKTTYADGVVEIEAEDARADPDILRGAQQRTIEAKPTSTRATVAADAHERQRRPRLTRDTFRRAMEPQLVATGELERGGVGKPARLFRQR